MSYGWLGWPKVVLLKLRVLFEYCTLAISSMDCKKSAKWRIKNLDGGEITLWANLWICKELGYAMGIEVVGVRVLVVTI